MKLVLKIIGSIVGVVVIIVAVVAVNLLVSGEFATLTPHFAGTCTALDTGGDSAEDIVIDHAAGFAYLSALDRRGQVQGRDVTGAIKRIDLKAETWTVEPAQVDGPSDFRPHGMSLLIGADGSRRLFVISHPKGKPHTVEVFDGTADNKWIHAATIRDTLLVKPNDLAAVGPQQFYVANDSGAHNGFDRATEMLFARRLSTIALYSGDRMTAAAAGVVGAGGIAVGADGADLYAAETAARRIRVYTRDAMGGLTPTGVIALTGGPDNIDVAPDGSLWVAAHAKTVALAKHFATGSPAPTQIFHIERPESDAPKVTEIYLNMGEQFSAGSVAAVYKDKMLMGSITERRVQICTLPAPKAGEQP